MESALVTGVPPGLAGLLLATVAEVSVNRPEVEARVVTDVTGPGMVPEKTAELIGADQAVLPARAERRQGQPGHLASQVDYGSQENCSWPGVATRGRR